MTTTTCAKCTELEIRLEERERIIDKLLAERIDPPLPPQFTPVYPGTTGLHYHEAMGLRTPHPDGTCKHPDV